MQHASVTGRSSQHGVAMIETAIALPILLAVILGSIQFGLIYEAKATLNHAALRAARAGAVEHADPGAIRRGLARGLVPLYSPSSSLAGFESTFARVDSELRTSARIRILNPTQEAFADFSEEVEGVREIPNDRLHVRSTARGAQSGINIQDANLLRVEITYGYELKVPLVNWFIARTLLALRGGSGYDAFEQQLLRQTRLPIISTSTVRMQSAARLSDLVVSRADMPDVERFDAGGAPPALDEDDDEARGDSDAPTGSEDDPSSGSSLADGFFGFGSGSAGSANPPSSGGEGETGGGDDGWIIGGGGPRDCPINTCCSPPRPPI
ncbi:MAG: pilus assembly protein [Xanthomonadaceae bacterium]|nr:pilus assembly protein [Xanthomonadaceae bacterium]